ncbi:MAG: hypothetical protein WDW36_004152 [Sanguina aurantia]
MGPITSESHTQTRHNRKLDALAFSVADIAFPTDAPPPSNSWTHTAAAGSHALSSTDCYLQPHQHATHGPRGGQSLCLSRNLILDSCAFSRQLTRASRFPNPVQGSVRLACELNHTAVGVEGMRNTNNKAWLAEAPQDRSYHEVALSCAAGSGGVVEVPTAFVMRDRGRQRRPRHGARQHAVRGAGGAAARGAGGGGTEA